MTTPLTHPITEDDIANYLGNTPDFFERHAELLAAVHLTSPHNGRSVSLQERQADMLREKIKALEHRIMDMIRNGNENVMLADKLLRWARTLFLTHDASILPEQIAGEIQLQFAVPQVGIRVWGVSEAYAQAGFAQCKSGGLADRSHPHRSKEDGGIGGQHRERDGHAARAAKGREIDLARLQGLPERR